MILIEMVIELIMLVIELAVRSLELAAEVAMALAEFAIMLFGGDRKFKRLRLRRERTPFTEMSPEQKMSRRGAVCLGVFLLLIFIAFEIYQLSTRTIRVTVEDGTPAPLAKFVWDKRNEARHARTNLRGELELPRFGVKAIRINDVRYESQTWKGALPDHVLLKRTSVGNSLDPFLLRMPSSGVSQKANRP